MVWVHITHFPQVSVKVFKTATEHPTKILGIAGFFCASLECLINQLVNLLAAVDHEGIDNFNICACINEVLGGKGCKELLHQEHEVNILSDDQAGGVLISKLGIKTIPKAGKESHAFFEILHGQVDKYFL